MSLIPLFIQGGLTGYLAGEVFKDSPGMFIGAVIANALLIVAYGIMRQNED